MTVNSTDYSALEDAIKATLVAAIGSGGTDYIVDDAIRIFNGDINLTAESFAEWGRTVHGPKIVIAIESIEDDEFVSEGGKYPRKTWQTVEVAFYLYDESLRGRREAMAGLSGTANAPGIWKMLNDVRAAMTGYVSAIHTLKWQGPFWDHGAARPIDQQDGKQLWRLPCAYRGCVEYSIDTSGLTAATIHGELDYDASTPDPDVETYPIP